MCTVIISLIPRLPCSRMRISKLCRRGEPGIFSYESNAKVGKGVYRKILIVREGTWRLRMAEKARVVGDSPLILVGGKHPYTPGVENRLNNVQNIVLQILILFHAHVRKDTRLSLHIHVSERRTLGMRPHHHLIYFTAILWYLKLKNDGYIS